MAENDQLMSEDGPSVDYTHEGPIPFPSRSSGQWGVGPMADSYQRSRGSASSTSLSNGDEASAFRSQREDRTAHGGVRGYWPYVDNVWVRQHRANSDKKGKQVSDYYACRLHRPTYTPSKAPRPEGKPTRTKKIREGGTCQMRLKVVRFEGGYTGLSIVQIGDQAEHTRS